MTAFEINKTTQIMSISLSEMDSLFEEAARLVVARKEARIGLLQGVLQIGYNRAWRIMDQLEAAGIIGSDRKLASRDVLVKDVFALEDVLDNLK